MDEFVIIVIVASCLYPMRNIFGILTRFSIYGLIAYTVFSDYTDDWLQKIMFVGILSIPILINVVFRFLKLVFIKS